MALSDESVGVGGRAVADGSGPRQPLPRGGRAGGRTAPASLVTTGTPPPARRQPPSSREPRRHRVHDLEDGPVRGVVASIASS
jgi:hypothetical protein